MKCKPNLEAFLEFQQQAARDKSAEVPSQERIDRLLNEINEAPRIIERLPQARKEDFLNRLRGIQLLPSSIAIQETAALAAGPSTWGARLDAIDIGRTGQEPKHFHGIRQESFTKEVCPQQTHGSNAMEVDQGDAGGSRASGYQHFKQMLGTP